MVGVVTLHLNSYKPPRHLTSVTCFTCSCSLTYCNSVLNLPKARPTCTYKYALHMHANLLIMYFVFSPCFTFIEQCLIWFILWVKIIWKDLTHQGIGVTNQIVLLYGCSFSQAAHFMNVDFCHIKPIFIYRNPCVPHYSLDDYTGLSSPL